MKRRAFLLVGFATLASTLLKQGLFFKMSQPKSDWVVPDLVFDQNLKRFDLTSTLPQGVIRGGKFGLSAQSAALPEGVRLTTDGFLVVEGEFPTALGSQVVFSYEEPHALTST